MNKLTETKWNVGNYEQVEVNDSNKYCPLEGIQERSLLSDVFFSSENIELLQKLIIHNVWNMSERQYKIGRQNETELVVIMRAIYLEYSQNLNCNIKKQIRVLNDKVLKYAVDVIIVNIKQQKEYINQLDQPLQMIDRGISTTVTGNKMKELTTFI
jgi:hypothetical protein